MPEPTPETDPKPETDPVEPEPKDPSATDPKDPEEPSFEERLAAAEKVNKDLERKLKRSEDNRTRVSELEAELAKLQGKEAEYAELQKQREAEQATLNKANERILKAEVRAQAAGKLADPQDALLHIDLSSFEVGDDGEVDASAITDAISDLITKKPYLAVQDGKRFQGGADAGARKEARPAQLSEADVKRLAAEGKHDEIVRAKAEGRLADYLAS